jgi:hypothetical protein
LISQKTPGAVIGLILVVITMAMGPIGSRMPVTAVDSVNSEKINLGINTEFSLENTTSIEFNKTFSLSEKRAVSLIHISCSSTEDMVESVTVNVTLNGVNTVKVFEDSSSDYNSPNSYYVGTTLNLRLDYSTPVYVLSNTLNLKLDIETAFSFNSEKGNFSIQEVFFETLTPPSISSISESIPVPLSVSEGNWYISPYSILKERTLESEIFADITEDIRVRVDVSINPPSIPLSSADIILTTPRAVYEKDDISSTGTIVANVKEGDTLYLDFRFRPSSDLSDSFIELSIDATVTYWPASEDTDGEDALSDAALMNVPVYVLEVVRLLMLIVPSLLFYKRLVNKKMIEEAEKAETKESDDINES